MNECTFCRIVVRELEAALLCENEFAVAFLDRSPVNPGHTLVVPRRHVTSFTELTEQEAGAVFQLIQRVGRAFKSASASREGISLAAADGEAAGQEVQHAHFHVIPRCAGDGFGWRRYGALAGTDSLGATAVELRQFMTEKEQSPAHS